VCQCPAVHAFLDRHCSKAKFGRCFADVYSQFFPSAGRCAKRRFEDDYFKAMGSGGSKPFFQHQLGLAQKMKLPIYSLVFLRCK